MPVVIDEVIVDVPSSESTSAPVAGPAASTGQAWTAELARALDEQLRLAIERRERLLAD